jgi:glutaredoxin
MKTLHVYTKHGCGSCFEAKKFLQQLAIPFEEINIDNDTVGLHFLQSQGERYLPQFYTSEGKKFMPGGWNTVRTMRHHEILDRLK